MHHHLWGICDAVTLGMNVKSFVCIPAERRRMQWLIWCNSSVYHPFGITVWTEGVSASATSIASCHKPGVCPSSSKTDTSACRTVLELVRDLVTDLAADGKRVKVCVQQALGQGVFQVRKNLALSVHVNPSRKCSLLCQLASPSCKCSTLEAVTVPIIGHLCLCQHHYLHIPQCCLLACCTIGNM